MCVCIYLAVLVLCNDLNFVLRLYVCVIVRIKLLSRVFVFAILLILKQSETRQHIINKQLYYL